MPPPSQVSSLPAALEGSPTKSAHHSSALAAPNAQAQVASLPEGTLASPAVTAAPNAQPGLQLKAPPRPPNTGDAEETSGEEAS